MTCPYGEDVSSSGGPGGVALDEARLSAREIADYLGHDQISMTQDVYMNRKATGGSAAKALADLPLDS